jgi:hypothetical protein
VARPEFPSSRCHTLGSRYHSRPSYFSAEFSRLSATLLRGGFGTPGNGWVLKWLNSELSRAALGYAETIRRLERLRLSCHPSNHSSMEARIAARARPWSTRSSKSSVTTAQVVLNPKTASSCSRSGYRAASTAERPGRAEAATTPSHRHERASARPADRGVGAQISLVCASRPVQGQTTGTAPDHRIRRVGGDRRGIV